MNPNAMFNISYGLFVLTSEADGKKNGCIINMAFIVIKVCYGDGI